MNKQEREKLREHANNHLNGRERDFTFFTPVEVIALLDQIDALELQVAEKDKKIIGLERDLDSSQNAYESAYEGMLAAMENSK